MKRDIPLEPHWVENPWEWIKESEAVFEAYHTEANLLRDKIFGLNERVTQLIEAQEDMKAFLNEVEEALRNLTEKVEAL